MIITNTRHEGYTITALNGLTTWVREFKMAKRVVEANPGAKIAKRFVEVQSKEITKVHVLTNEDGSETVIGYDVKR
jgi:hypothetical protein